METGSISTPAKRERELRERAVTDANALYAEHGGAAIGLLRDRLIDQGRDAERRRCDRLTLLATERLDRKERQSVRPAAPVARKPPLFSMARLAGLFGAKRHRR